MHCEFCGLKNKDTYISCSNCGKILNSIIVNNSLSQANKKSSQISQKNPIIQNEVDTKIYSFPRLCDKPNLKSIRKYWDEKLDSVTISTKWLDFFVRFLMVIQLYYSLYAGIGFFETVIAVFLNRLPVFYTLLVSLAMLISSGCFICYFLSWIYLRRWNSNGLKLLWIYTILHLTSASLTIAIYVTGNIYGLFLAILPSLIMIAVLLIPNLIYFEKRRFMYYEESSYNMFKLKLDQKHKHGILILFFVWSILLVTAFIINHLTPIS